jgi:hypothetical protein
VWIFRFFGSAAVLLVAIVAVALLAPQFRGQAPAAPGTPAAAGQGVAPAAAEPVPPPPGPGEVRLEFDEATLTQMANANLGAAPLPDTPLGTAQLRDIAVQLRGGQITARGTAMVGPTPLPVQLAGAVQAQNGRPTFALSDARIGPVQMPQAARRSVEQLLQSQLDQLVAAERIRVSSVTAGSGKLTIIGRRA